MTASRRRIGRYIFGGQTRRIWSSAHGRTARSAPAAPCLIPYACAQAFQRLSVPEHVTLCRALAARARCHHPFLRLTYEIDSRSLVSSQDHVTKSTFSAQHASISRSQLRWRERVEQRALRRGCDLATARGHFGSPEAARKGGTAHGGRASIGACTTSIVDMVLTCRSS